MKKILTVLLMLAGLVMKAQTLTNPNFESWAASSSYYTDTLPANWWPFYCNTVHPTTDSYQGTYATKIQGWFACGIAPGVLVNGQEPLNYGNFMESGTPFTTKPASISGYYKYTDVTPGDSAEVTIILKRYNAALMKRDTIAFSTQALAPSTSYSLFTVNINDMMPGVIPDSIIIMFNSSKYYMFDMITMALPVLYIDRLLLPETPNGIAESNDMTAGSFMYPNPITGSSTLSITEDLSNSGEISIEIFDTQGKKVMELNRIKNNEVLIQKAHFSAGSYVYVVRRNKSFISRGKFVVQ